MQPSVCLGSGSPDTFTCEAGKTESKTNRTETGIFFPAQLQKLLVESKSRARARFPVGPPASTRRIRRAAGPTRRQHRANVAFVRVDNFAPADAPRAPRNVRTFSTYVTARWGYSMGARNLVSYVRVCRKFLHLFAKEPIPLPLVHVFEPSAVLYLLVCLESLLKIL
ncbi:hypothetical protein ACLOJK_011532 [Asimina triloba]